LNNYYYQRGRGLKRKLHLINLRGGECEKCGYNKNISAFDFHHMDPKNKDFKLDIRNLGNHSMSKILKEFDKCILLCSNCHREEHFPDLTMSNVEKLVEELEETILKNRTINKPKCIDCDKDINYGSKRCVECNNEYRRRNIPDLNILKKEYDENGVTWCSRKYNISRTSIKRYLNLI